MPTDRESGPPGRAGSLDLRWFLIGWAFLLPLYLLPLVLTRFLPGLDLPFHLAICDMLRKSGPGSPYGAAYLGQLGLAPYAVHYGLLRVLGLVLPLGIAHKLIMAAYVAGLPLALGRLLGRCGRSRLPGLLGFPLAYNMAVHYGFISFALSVPVLLWLLAETAAATDPAEGPARGAAPGVLPALRVAVVALLLFFCHLQNFVFGVGGALALLAFTGGPVRRRLPAALALVPALGAMVYWQISSRFLNAARSDLGYALKVIWATRKSNVHGGLAADLLARTRVFPQHLLKGFVNGRDQWSAVGVIAAVLLYVVIGLLLRRRRGPGERSPARLRLGGAVVLGLGLLLYYGMPHHLREFELMTFYPRFSVAVAALLTLLIPGWLLRAPPRLVPLLLLPALLPALLHGVLLSVHYRAFGRETADFAEVLDRTPPGGRALGLVYDRVSRVLVNESLMVGLPSYYPIERPAPTSMVPLTYCGMRHMPCRLGDPGAQPPDPGAWAPSRLDVPRALPYFDYFFVRAGPPAEKIFGRWAGDVEALARAGTWVVYRKRTRAR